MNKKELKFAQVLPVVVARILMTMMLIRASAANYY